MINQMIAMTTEEGDVVLDPFAGSGVVGSEATKLGRGSYSVEMNPDVAQNITMPRIASAIPVQIAQTPQNTASSKPNFQLPNNLK